MRVLVSFTSLGRGGDAVQLFALVDALRLRGHDVTVVGAHPVAPYAFNTVDARAKGVLRRLPWWVRDGVELGLTVVSAVRAARAGRARRVDLMIHRGAVYDYAASALPRFVHAPMVLYLDSHVAAERAYCDQAYWRRLHAWAMRMIGQSAAVIVTPSQAVADYYRSLGLPAGRIVIRRNGVSERHLRLGLDAADAHPPCTDPHVSTIGFVGSLSKWHRVDLLLDAVRLLRERRNGAGRSRTMTSSERCANSTAGPASGCGGAGASSPTLGHDAGPGAADGPRCAGPDAGSHLGRDGRPPAAQRARHARDSHGA